MHARPAGEPVWQVSNGARGRSTGGIDGGGTVTITIKMKRKAGRTVIGANKKGDPVSRVASS